MPIQFKDGVVLFRNGVVSFCPDDCDCPGDNPDTPPDDRNHCADCQSLAPCVHCSGCTPKYLSLLLEDIEIKDTCLVCGDTSVVVNLLSTPDAFILRQDPYLSCRWSYTIEDAAILSVVRYPSADCTGVGEESNTLVAVVERTSTGFELQVYASFTDAQYLLATAAYDSEDCDPSVTVDLDDLAFECGLRLGKAGTATIAACPDIPLICTCTNSPDCVRISGITGLGSVTGFTADETTNEAVEAARTDTCEWFTADLQTVGGASNVRAKIHWYNEGDSHATEGCGYYLYLYYFNGVEDVEAGYYFLNAATCFGRYIMVDNWVEGLPINLTVGACNPIHDCSDTSSYPTTILVRISNAVAGLEDMLGDWEVPWSEGLLVFAYDLTEVWGGGSIRLECGTTPDGWTIIISTGVDSYVYRSPPYPRTPYVGDYPFVSGSGGDVEAWSQLIVQVL